MKTKEMVHTRTFRTKRRNSFTKVSINQIIDKITKKHGPTPDMLKKVASLSILKLRKQPGMKRKKSQSVGRKQLKLSLQPPQKLLHMLKNLQKAKLQLQTEAKDQLKNLTVEQKRTEEV